MGLIHLDAGVVIGFLDGNDAHHDTARQVLADARHAGGGLEWPPTAKALELRAALRRI